MLENFFKSIFNRAVAILWKKKKDKELYYWWDWCLLFLTGFNLFHFYFGRFISLYFLWLNGKPTVFCRCFFVLTKVLVLVLLNVLFDMVKYLYFMVFEVSGSALCILFICWWLDRYFTPVINNSQFQSWTCSISKFKRIVELDLKIDLPQATMIFFFL